MSSAKKRLHEVLRKGHPSRDAEPDYTRALNVLAEAINERSDRLGDLEDEVEALKEGEQDYDAIAGLTGRFEERVDENVEHLEQALTWIERLQESMVDKARSIEELSQEVGDRKREMEGLDTRLGRLEEQLADVEQKVDDTDQDAPA